MSDSAPSSTPAGPGTLAWTAAPAGVVFMFLSMPLAGGVAVLPGIALALIGTVAAAGCLGRPNGGIALLLNVCCGVVVLVVAVMLNGAMGNWH